MQSTISMLNVCNAFLHLPQNLANSKFNLREWNTWQYHYRVFIRKILRRYNRGRAITQRGNQENYG